VVRAIHFLAAIEGNYWQEAPRSKIWFSGYWDPSGNFEPTEDFSDVWIMLHKPTQAKKSFLGGPILDFLADDRPEFSRSARFVFKFELDRRAKEVAWPKTGRGGANVHCSRLVDWDLPSA